MKKELGLDSFAMAYAIAALWSTTDDDGEHLDNKYNVSDFSPKALTRIINDCGKFYDEMKDVLAAAWESSEYRAPINCTPLEYAGHDFWLTRAGHGCGFWDGDYPEKEGEILTEKAKEFGEVDIYVGDDGKLYI